MYTFFCVTDLVCDGEGTREVCFEVGSLCFEVGWIVGCLLDPCVYFCSIVVRLSCRKDGEKATHW